MEQRLSAVGAALVAGTTIVVLARAASAPAPPPPRRATVIERAVMAMAIATAEPEWRAKAEESFPEDHWSQRDDFHGKEAARVREVARKHGVPYEEVLRAIDDDLHRGPPAAGDARGARGPVQAAPVLRLMIARLADKMPIRLAIYALLAAALVWPALGDAAKVNEFRDAQVLMLYERAAALTVKAFGELPLWNPYYCGGLDGLGAPQSRFASPTFLLSLLFGPERAEVPIVFFFALLGMEGTFRWLRARLSNALAAAMIAPVFALSGHFSVAFYRGWTAFFGFEFVPWILFGVTLAARGRVGGIALASIGFAVMLGFGGTFAAPLVAVVCLLEGARAVLERSRADRTRALATLGATAIFMAAVAAARLWPIAETLAAAPRIMAGTPGHGPAALASAIAGTLAVNDGDVGLAGSFFVGAGFLVLVALGTSIRRALPATLIVLLLLWLAAGYARNPSLFALLRELPIMAALRYPERFLWLAVLFACEPAARAIDWLPYLGDGKSWRRAAWALSGALVLWSVASELATFERVATARELGAIAHLASEHGFRQARGNRWLAAHQQAIGAGSLSCWETHPVVQSPMLRADLPREEYALGAGEVTRLAWSPRSITLRADLPERGLVVVNQNWHPGWRASAGAVVSQDGLLAVELPAGTTDVTLSFRPWSATAGALVSGVALLALGVLALRAKAGWRPFARGSRVATAAITLLPCGVAAAAIRLSPDPQWPALTPRNANGSPAIVTAPENDALPVEATFALPIRVEAGRVQGPDALSNLAVDVWLRRTGALARSTAAFVHLERRPGFDVPKEHHERFLADHQVISGTFYLSDVPEGRLIHDAFGVHLDKPAPGTWDVWLAFGHASGRRGRAKLVEAGRSGASEHRVRIGTFQIR